LKISKKLSADFVELCVWYGVLSKAALNTELDNTNDLTFYLCDPWDQKKDMNKIQKNIKYSVDIYDVVKIRFEENLKVRLIRGSSS
jgi:hypothetical protein